MNHDEKKIAQALKLREESEARRGWGCLSEEQIAAFADHQLSGAQRDKVEAHLADCEYCQSQVAFLARAAGTPVTAEFPVHLRARAQGLAPAKNQTGLSGWRWRTAFSVAAAAACVTLAVVVSERRPNTPVQVAQTTQTSPGIPSQISPGHIGPPTQVAPPQERSIPKVGALPNLLFPRRDSTISRDKLEFRWDAVPAALDYSVHVTTDEGDVVWDHPAEKNAAQVPPDVNLEPGRKYFVWVEAHLTKGKSVRSSAVAFAVSAQR